MINKHLDIGVDPQNRKLIFKWNSKKQIGNRYHKVFSSLGRRSLTMFKLNDFWTSS